MRYHQMMRTTLDIDEDVLATVKDLAKAEGKTMGEVISDLARRALTTPSLPGLSESAAAFDTGTWPTFPGREGVLVTTEMIERIQAEIDHEDSEPKDVSAVDDASCDHRAG